MVMARYNSLADYVDAAMGAPFANSDNRARHERFLVQKDRREWYGLKQEGIGTLAGVARMATCDGWQRGADMLARIRETLDVPRLGSIKRRRIRSDRGDTIDMQRVYTGQLDTAWTRTARTNKVHNPRVFIMVDSLASGGMDAETMMWRGAAATMLGDLLSEAGYSVSIASGFIGYTSSRELMDVRVAIKPYNAPWDLNSAAAAVCSPAFFRALGHSFMWHHATKPADTSGMSVFPMPESKVMEDDTIETPHRFLAPQRITSQQAALEWVRECVAKLETERGA